MGLYKLIEKKKKEQKRKENIKIAKVATATTILGAAVGAVSGVLFAPKAGKETREDIKNKASEVSGQVVEKAKDVKEALSEKVVEGKEDLVEAKKKISEYLESKKSKVEKIEEDVEETAVEEESTIDINTES